MRGTDTLRNVAEVVYDLDARNHDEVIPVMDMEFSSLDNMWIAGQEVELLPSAQRLFANRLRVPYSYLNRCPVDLQAQNLNHWLREEAGNRETLFCRFNGGHSLRAVFTERYTVLDNVEVVRSMLEHGFSPEREIHYTLDDALMVLKVPDPSRSFHVSANDKLVPGIGISNSEVGILAFGIQAYFYRLVCSNGLIAQTAVSSKFRHISRKGLDEFPVVMNQVVYESEQSQGKFRLSIESPVEDPIASIGAFNRQFQIGKEPGQLVENAWGIEPGYNLFAVINAYTRAAQEKGLTAEEAYSLEKTGGRILAMVKH